ncbi:cadherin-23-like [Amphiura filiformis]|uniref:cadherin-23-like n=1 Tax=Amphiura filiformis TaxID=82378 RepID=UPI003B223330
MEMKMCQQTQDINDVVPSFSQDVYTRPDFPEDSDIGTTVIIISATDEDLGAGGQVRYEIVDGNNQGYFTIDPVTGLITLVTKLPSVETISTYNLTIRARDQASPNHVSFSDVVIHIRPALEVVPQFTMSRYVGNVTENADFGTLILEVLATLPDGSFISYTIDENVNPTIFDLFSLHPNSGEITVEGTIDRERGSFYTFTVLAYNGGSVPGSAAVWVHVLDENDNAPVFVLRPNERMMVQENLPVGTVVAEFDATDADMGLNAEVIYNITSGDDMGHFRIEITSDGVGQVVTTTPLDRETIETYNLEITASDLGTPVQKSSITFEVVVTDVNDNPPNFANSSFTGISTEGTLSNTPVVTVIVDDRDIPSSNNLEFVIISGDPDGVFTIDSTGEIRQTAQLDRETQAFYNLTVLVRDNSYDSSYQTTTFAYITIGDTNDNPPQFVGAPYIANITEGPDSNNKVVVIVKTEDGDTGVNGE